MRYRHGSTTYEIAVRQVAGVGDDRHAGSLTLVTLDGVAQPDASLPLVDDGAEHTVVVTVHTAPG